jgi:hypothetical protein
MDPQEVAQAVLAALTQDELPFRIPIGWNPIRMATVAVHDVDAYERELFEYYKLGSFRGKSATSVR